MDNCTIPHIQRTLANPNRLAVTIDQMCRNDALSGTVHDLGEDLRKLFKDNPEHFDDFRQGALQAVDIYDPGGWLGEAVSGSDFDLSELKEGRASIFLVIPQEQLAAYSSYLGIMTRQVINAVAGSSGDTDVLMLLDEFGSMGKIEGLAESLTGLPALGVKVWMICQSLKQLNEIYGPHRTSIILGACEVKQFFCVRQAEAPIVSQWLGQETVLTRSYNLGRDWGDAPTVSVGATGKPLMTPDEIVRMDPRDQLLFVENKPPILARRTDYRSVVPWRDWAADNPVEKNPVRKTRYEFSLRYR